MQLKKFRIEMFKCILDSGWVDVEDLTVLVGKNEAGKTSLLKALHKFNPFDASSYSIAREWPRGHRGERSEDRVVCSAEFELTPDELEKLSSLTTEKSASNRVIVTRDYAGRFEVQLPNSEFPDKLHPNEIDKSCESLPVPAQEVSSEFKEIATYAREEAIRIAKEGRYSELEKLAAEQESKLVATSPQNPHQTNENNHRNAYITALRAAAAKLAATPSIQSNAHELIVSNLPTFVYMDEYRSFRGTAFLDQVHQRKVQGKLTEDDTTLLTIMTLAELDIDEEAKKGADQDREERQYDLSDAAATLNRKVEDHWKQLRYEVDFRADGHQFMTFVKGEKDKALIRLEERSQGFQWFFSFDLMLMHETQGSLAGCVILLDEPGLHLHPAAQADLLERLESYAEGNTLIYSTHLPFMINLRTPERIRVIGESAEGSFVDENLTHTQPEAKLVLQAALGLGGRTSFLLAEKNLVVEGVDDYWIITELSNLLERSGETGLMDEVFITPAGGASEATYIATLMIGQELQVVALYDTDDSGNSAKDKLVKNWLTRYNDAMATALSLGEAVESKAEEFSIEDLFTEEFYMVHVNAVYAKELAAAGSDFELQKHGSQLVKRVEASFSRAEIRFNKGSVCKAIRKKIRSLAKISDLPKETADAAKKLIGRINTAFTSEPGITASAKPTAAKK